MNQIKVILSMEKEIINDKNLIYNDVKEVIKKLESHHVVSSSISNELSNSCNRHKQIVKEQKTITENLNLPRNEFPIDELEYDGKIYPFSKTRLAVDSNQNSIIQYIFHSRKQELDRDTLFEEIIEKLKKDKEFAEIKERIWPEGFKSKSDIERFGNEI